ncbi:MAG TPA: caspase family protein, partial [Polyangia bacterium]|nr:caspase family protein [Polyangia bacterium]
MVLRRALTVFVPLAAALAVIGGGDAYAQQVRHALLLGNDTGNDPTRRLRYAEQEVVRMGELLRRSGDFDTVDVLRGGRRADVEGALTAAAQTLAAARQAGHSTLFLFYYSGHGDNEALELGATRLPLRDLRTYLEKLPADIRVAFVDACQSGALTGVKGGRRAPVYDVHLADTGNVKGLAVVTSSTATELSQESEDLRGSYFSNNLMAGLQGLADTSRDGQVTLAEVYDFAFRRTLANTAANLTGGQHPTYDFRMSGTGDVVLTRIRAKDGQLRFQHEAGATYTVFGHDPVNDQVIAELVTNPGEDLYLAIPAGRYRVVRRTMAGVSESTVQLAGGAAVTLEPQNMTAVLVSRGDG